MKTVPVVLLSTLFCFLLAGTTTPGLGKDSGETRYLLFQIFTYTHEGNAQFAAAFPPKAEIDGTVKDIVRRIGTTGSAQRKLSFCVGPLTLSQSDDETRQLIKRSFQIARENKVAVAFHVDDQMFWENNTQLRDRNSDDIEWTDWNKTHCTGRRLDWGPQPTRVAPQLCLNDPFVQDIVRKRGYLIGTEIRREIDQLKSAGKSELFAGIMAGWESQIGRDFATNKCTGYHALENRGLTSANSSEQCDRERINILREFMELWSGALAKGGIPVNKIYCHIAFTPQGFETPGAMSYAQQVDFAVPDVAFDKSYRPGFSTYPDEGALEQILAETTKHGNPPWISAEGTNVVPNGMSGESTMETYLGKMFNHGAVMVNVYSWGMGGEAQKNNLFRRATENDEALSAYRKFLSAQPLKELPRSASGFSPTKFRHKIDTIQSLVPAWVNRTHRTDVIQPLMTKLDTLIKSNQFEAADKQADSILRTIGSSN